MATISVINQEGKNVKEIEISSDIFEIEPNQQAMYDAILMQQAGKRQGTHDTKGRSEVRGGGRKPYRQKGTGRARQGTIRAPQFRGGGTVFGPTPRSYKFKLNRKVRRLALKSALSEKFAESSMKVVDTFSFAEPKTKEFVKVIDACGFPRKTLFVVSEEEDYHNALLSMRNIPTHKMVNAQGINVYDIVNANEIVFTEKALRNVEEVFG